MARIHQSGFEMNSLSSNVEWTFIGSSNATTDNLSARTGGFGFHFGPGTSFSFIGGVSFQFAAAAATGPYFVRGYLRIKTRPNATATVMALHSGTSAAGDTPQAKITLESNGTLILRNQSGTQIGSASSALTSNNWYMVQLKFDASGGAGASIIEGQLDGATFATSSTQSPGNVLAYAVGGNLSGESFATGEWHWDDTALNDSTGALQIGYPGEGRVVHLRPRTAGDANAFSTQTGGTAGSANNWTRVSDVAPDDATTFNGSPTLNAEDLFKLTPPAWAGIGSNDTITVVLVGGRMRNNLPDATAAIKLEIEKTTAGTIAQSAAIVLNTLTFSSNAPAVPRNYPLVLYQDPDGANWTPASLANTQIGYKITTAGSNRFDVTTVWASVDFVQYTGPPTLPPGMPLGGVG